jgi:2-keto-4-pentenoate hydratase
MQPKSELEIALKMKKAIPAEEWLLFDLADD